MTAAEFSGWSPISPQSSMHTDTHQPDYPPTRMSVSSKIPDLSSSQSSSLSSHSASVLTNTGGIEFPSEEGSEDEVEKILSQTQRESVLDEVERSQRENPSLEEKASKKLHAMANSLHKKAFTGASAVSSGLHSTSEAIKEKAKGIDTHTVVKTAVIGLAILGAVSLFAGICMVCPPAALMIAGVGLLGAAFAIGWNLPRFVAWVKTKIDDSSASYSRESKAEKYTESRQETRSSPVEKPRSNPKPEPVAKEKERLGAEPGVKTKPRHKIEEEAELPEEEKMPDLETDTDSQDAEHLKSWEKQILESAVNGKIDTTSGPGEVFSDFYPSKFEIKISDSKKSVNVEFPTVTHALYAKLYDREPKGIEFAKRFAKCKNADELNEVKDQIDAEREQRGLGFKKWATNESGNIKRQKAALKEIYVAKYKQNPQLGQLLKATLKLSNCSFDFGDDFSKKINQSSILKEVREEI